eukprot:3437798-Alexandrium_andersonii.AAC.1
MPLQGEDGDRARRPAARVERGRAGRVVRQGRGRGCRAVPRSHRHLAGRGRAAAQRQLVAGGHPGCQGWRLGRAL